MVIPEVDHDKQTTNRPSDNTEEICQCLLDDDHLEPEYALPANPSRMHPSERLVMLPYMLTKQGYVPLETSGFHSRAHWPANAKREKRTRRKEGDGDQAGLQDVIPTGQEETLTQEQSCNNYSDFEAPGSTEVLDNRQTLIGNNEANLSLNMKHGKQPLPSNFSQSLGQEANDFLDSLNLQGNLEVDSLCNLSLLSQLDCDIVQQAAEVAELTGIVEGLPLEDGEGPGYWDDVPMTVADVVTVPADQWFK